MDYEDKLATWICCIVVYGLSCMHAQDTSSNARGLRGCQATTVEGCDRPSRSTSQSVNTGERLRDDTCYKRTLFTNGMYSSYKTQVEMSKGTASANLPTGNADLQELWAKLKGADPSKCKSLLKKHLTQERFDKLKDKKTKFGGTLADCIRSGCMNLDSGVGIYACDPDAYTVFADVLDAVILDYHKVKKLDHPKEKDTGKDKLNFPNLDPSGDYIVSTRVRVGRSHDSYGFPPVLTKEQRLKMEKDTKAAFETFSGDLAGSYLPLEGMSSEQQKKLTAEHFLFKDDDRFLRDASGYNDWCSGRGIFFNNKRDFLVWVNEEDHLRLISMEKGGDLSAVFGRLIRAMESMEKSGLSFAKRDGLGFLTFCPSNLGTGLRASVHMKIPHLAAQPNFKQFCEDRGIQARGIHGEHTESVGGVYDLSNKRRLGLTEFEAVQEMKKGVEECLTEEKRLEAAAKK